MERLSTSAVRVRQDLWRAELSIQEVALPHTTSIRFFLEQDQVFQNPSKAVMKPDLGVSSQGSSSIKINCLVPSSLLCKNSSSMRKASIQLSGHFDFCIP